MTSSRVDADGTTMADAARKASACASRYASRAGRPNSPGIVRGIRSLQVTTDGTPGATGMR